MQIELSFRGVLIIAAVLLASAGGFAIYHTVTKNSYEARIVELQNDVASRDKTIETQKGVYERLSIQSQDLTKLIGDKDKELSLLKKQLDDRGAEILAINKLVVKLKKDLESTTGNVVIQPPDPKYPGMVVAKLDSKEDFDPFRLTGEVVVDCNIEQGQPPKASLKLGQKRALLISVVVSQDNDGTWRSSTTSSEKNFDIDIALSAVNPRMLEAKWYEKIGLGVDIGVGTNPGFLLGLGAYYQIGRFDVGPRAWMVVDRGVSAYFGAQLIWHPFAK